MMTNPDIRQMGLEGLHTHTVFSDGRLEPREVWEIAREQGCRVGIADHCGVGSFQMNRDRDFEEYLRALEPYPVYRSAELDLGTEVRISPQLLARCDYLIGGVHSLGGLNFFDPEAALPSPDELIEGMLQLIREKVRIFRFQILAHPGLLPTALRGGAEGLLGKEWGQRLITLALEFGFALEISSRWKLPGPETIRQAREAGVRFALGSDGHGRENVCRLDYSLEMVRQLAIGPEMMYRPASAGR
jgi:histidinol phosphatase-like PHP family hydrolase